MLRQVVFSLWGSRVKRGILNAAIIISLLCIAVGPLHSAEGIGADLAATRVAQSFARLPIKVGETYRFSEAQTIAFIGLAADIQINVFELIDCSYRYLAPRDMRIRIEGDDLREAERFFDLGRERVNAILPVEDIDNLELGALNKPDQAAMDVQLLRESSQYVEIGTAKLALHFGFRAISPLLFEAPYGIKVQRLIFTTDFLKLELYAPGKAALFVVGVPRPKRWNIWMVRRIGGGA